MKFLLSLLCLLLPTLAIADSGVDYDIAFVRSKVPSGRMSIMPAVGAEFATEESKLYVLRQDGSEELLYDPGPGKAILDPRQDLTGQWVYFSQIDGLTVG